MTNAELNQKRLSLRDKRDKIAGMNPFTAANEMKAAAMLAAEIADELARRELQREWRQEGDHGA